MDKLEYIRKVFAQTKGKTFENYAITQIWAGVKHLSICPVMQQYVKRPGGTYALLDLYFPQIDLAVEIDEKAHEKNIPHDKMRADDVFKAIQDEGKSIVIRRIKEAPYEEVEQAIQETIDAIAERAKQYSPLVWENDWQQEEHARKFDEIKKRGFLDISDTIGFTRLQVTNDIFGMNKSEGYLQFGKSWFTVDADKQTMLWFPHLTRNKKWENKINAAWTEIEEKRIVQKKDSRPSKSHDPNILRYTFARYKNALGETSYRYIGNFRFSREENNTFYYVRDNDNNRVSL